MEAMFGNEISVSPAAIHEVRMQFAAQFGLGLFDDAGEPGNSLELGFAQRELVCRKNAGTWLAFLFSEEK